MKLNFTSAPALRMLLTAATLLVFDAVANAQSAGEAASPPIVVAQTNDSKGAQKRDPVSLPPQQQLQVPPPEVLLLLIRTSIIAVDQANKTNNYTVLRALAGPSLQALSPEKVADHFADMRSKMIDLSPTVVVSPQLVRQPAISPAGMLTLIGYFPTQPLQVQFEINMQPVQGFWRLAGMSINAIPPGQPAAQPSSKDAKEAPKKK